MKHSADSEFACHQCGAEVHPNARACRNCGARRETAVSTQPPSWHQPEHLDGIDLPDDEGGGDGNNFDYDDYIAREFGESHRNSADGEPRDWKKLMWWLTALITLIAFIFLVVRF